MLRYFLILLVTASGAIAQTAPTLIPFQGRLTDQQGQVRTNGVYTLIFNLYDQAVGGNNLWTERHERVGVINGMVNVFLGSIAPLDAPGSAVNFTSTRYLGITVDADNNSNTADPEMVPRQMIIPAFWAKNSDKLAGADWSSILVSGNNPVAGFLNAAKILPESITGFQIRSNSVTYPKLARRRYVESNGPQIGDMVASQPINYSTKATDAWQIVDGSQVTLNTSGGPVLVSIVPLESAAGNPATLNVGAGTYPYGGGYPPDTSPYIEAYVSIFVDGVPAVTQVLRTDANISAARLTPTGSPFAAQFGGIGFIAVPISFSSVLANLSGGVHTFEIRVKSQLGANMNTVSLAAAKLLVYEP